jgi:CRISPR/Cas system-associated exonuclease Cas4 (RecB family)
MDKKTIIFSLIIVVLLGMTIVNYQKRKAVEGIAGNPSASEEQQKAKEIVQKVQQLLFLGDEKNPTVAAIVDIEKLRAQSPFYAHAENGDYVIVTSKKAIIYSPSKNQIIDVVPIELKPKASQETVEEPKVQTVQKKQ